jgi:hypothetical protein
MVVYAVPPAGLSRYACRTSRSVNRSPIIGDTHFFIPQICGDRAPTFGVGKFTETLNCFDAEFSQSVRLPHGAIGLLSISVNQRP